MTATYYISFTVDPGKLKDVSHNGTTSTAADVIELRMGNGTYLPGRLECIEALKNFQRWIIQGGLQGNGTNLPPD